MLKEIGKNTVKKGDLRAAMRLNRLELYFQGKY